MSNDKPLYVTESYLPPLEEYVELLRGIWDRKQLTNQGPINQNLEQKLADYLNMEEVLTVCNCGVGIQIALHALEVEGDVITTPFSYVATTSCLLWEHRNPVFVDIDPHTLAIDANLIEAAITPKTTGILATHVYGIPCDVEAIQRIADKHGLKVIYDAAHAFGVEIAGRSVLEWGDASVVSFHATKVMHTAEGGAFVSPHRDVMERVAWMRRFGHNGPEAFHGVGINGKMSELHAGLGLLQIDRMDEILGKRRRVAEAYDRALATHGLPLTRPTMPEGIKPNFAYYPVLFESEAALLLSLQELHDHNIYPRRYFYPSLDRVFGAGNPLPVSDSIAARILCLPLSPTMTEDDVERVSSALSTVLSKS